MCFEGVACTEEVGFYRLEIFKCGSYKRTNPSFTGYYMKWFR